MKIQLKLNWGRAEHDTRHDTDTISDLPESRDSSKAQNFERAHLRVHFDKICKFNCLSYRKLEQSKC